MAWEIEQIKARCSEMVALAAVPTSNRLVHQPFCVLSKAETGAGTAMTVCFSEPFLKHIRKNRVGTSPALWKTLQNLQYGYDPKLALSPGGRDGIFAISSDFRPKNDMVRKLYDRFFDTAKGQNLLKLYFQNPADTQGVRVVSHDMRLLGFIGDEPETGWRLVLVDVDVNRR